MTRKTAHPHVTAAVQYCRDVLACRIPAGKWVHLACHRHLEDLKRERTKAFRFKFEPEEAERVCRFFELLPHVKGKWAKRDPKHPHGQRLRLEPWQCFIVANIFGWTRKGCRLRRFRKASVYLPRKNGKSTLAGGLGWWMFGKDGEPGAEIYSGATTEKQAWEVFGPARQMALTEPQLPEALGVTVNASNMIRLEDASKFEPIIGKPGDGASPHCAIVDEYHEHPTADLYDTMLTGMGAREQPLLLVISTAGYDISGPCYDDWLTVQKLLEGTLADETHFGVIYAADPEDDWTSEIALRKANPNAGVSVSIEFLQSQLRDAIGNPRKQGVFKTKHLNIWQNARDAYVNMQRWTECREADLTLDEFRGRRCYIGMDLASKVDIAALELLFPLDDGAYARFGRYYLPDETVQLPQNDHYRGWARADWLTVTEGNIIDFGRILEDLVALATRFEVVALGYDPFQATMLVTELMNAGLPCVEVRPTVLNFSEPMKQADALIRARKLRHNGDPVMAWMVSNVVAKLDAKDNVFPRKEREEQKIDGFVALVTALACALRDQTPDLDEAFNNPLIMRGRA
ncbi:MAG TPA: terminase large subunit [Thauera aminoaromatica]|nr:terminase large subunit [Thauera aminoaromatica]